MNNILKMLFCFTILFSLSGCASDSVQMIGKARTSIEVSQVQVFMAPPDFTYESIARVRARVQQGFDKQERMQNTIAELKEQAAKMGANGIVINNADAFYAAYTRVSIGTAFLKGASLDVSPEAFQSVQLVGIAIHVE